VSSDAKLITVDAMSLKNEAIKRLTDRQTDKDFNPQSPQHWKFRDVAYRRSRRKTLALPQIRSVDTPSYFMWAPVTTAWRVLSLRMERTASRYGG